MKWILNRKPKRKTQMKNKNKNKYKKGKEPWFAKMETNDEKQNEKLKAKTVLNGNENRKWRTKKLNVNIFCKMTSLELKRKWKRQLAW